MKEEGAEILEHLANRTYDGVHDCDDYKNTFWGIKIENGIPVKWSQKTYKFFDGRENVRETSEKKYEYFLTDEEKLHFFRKYGWKSVFYDYPEIFDYCDRHSSRSKDTTQTVNDSKPQEDEKEPETSNLSDFSSDEYSLTTDTEDNGPDMRIVVGIAVAAAAVFGAIKVAPHIGKLWVNKVAPGMKKILRKITRKEDVIEEADADDTPKDDATPQVDTSEQL
jgi:hypothetical protein